MLYNNDDIDYSSPIPLTKFTLRYKRVMPESPKEQPLAVDDPFMVAAYDCDDQTASIPSSKTKHNYIKDHLTNVVKTLSSVTNRTPEEEGRYRGAIKTLTMMPTEKELELLSNAKEEITTNDRGGRQSKIESNFHLMHLLPEYCYQVVFSILEAGAVKYGKDNWMKISTEDHINHAIRHLRLFLSGDTSENHLGNAACRCLFALYTANHGE